MLLWFSENFSESLSTISLLKATTNDLLHTKEGLSALWPRFSLFPFIFSGFCDVTVTAGMQVFHFASLQIEVACFQPLLFQ